MKGENKMKEQYYIVRGANSGVYFGKIASRNGQEVEMTDVRNIWYWDGAASILQLAKEGVKAPKNCKFTVSVDSLTLTDAIEIIPCTEAAIKNIKAVAEWKR